MHRHAISNLATVAVRFRERQARADADKPIQGKDRAKEQHLAKNHHLPQIAAKMAHNENVIHTEKDLTLTTKTLSGIEIKRC